MYPNAARRANRHATKNRIAQLLKAPRPADVIEQAGWDWEFADLLLRGYGIDTPTVRRIQRRASMFLSEIDRQS